MVSQNVMLPQEWIKESTMQYRGQRSSGLSKWVWGIFFASAFAIVLWFTVYVAGVVYVAYKAANVDWSGGVKPVIERVWCGEVGCMDKK
jgi:ABC-type uncharacterized transport system permease subunit